MSPGWWGRGLEGFWATLTEVLHSPWDLLLSPLQVPGAAREQNPPASPDRAGSRQAVPAGLQLETTGMRRGQETAGTRLWEQHRSRQSRAQRRGSGWDVLLRTPCHHHACPGGCPVLAPAPASPLLSRQAPHVWQPQRKSTLMKCFPAVIGFPLYTKSLC